MYELLKRSKKLIIIFLIIVSLLTYLIIYLPMRNELENSTHENFILMGKANERTINQFIERCIEGAESLSSRTMIRRKIIEYKNKKIDFNELRKYTKELYKDGYDALENPKGAFRIVDNKIVIKNGDIDPNIDVNIHNGTKTIPEIRITEKDATLIVYSPIKEKEEILGYDVVFYDLDSILERVNESKIDFEIVEEQYALNLAKNKEYIRDIDGVRLFNEGEHTGYIRKIELTDKYYYIAIDNDMLYRSIARIARITFIGFVLALAVLIILINFVILKSTISTIKKLEKSREKYKQYAIKDPLTEVYSQLYFEDWVERYSHELNKNYSITTIAMIDIDNLKEVNNIYGHLTGDRVLKEIANVLKSKAKEKDLIIRFGGDEFLLVLKECDEKRGILILEDIMESLEKKKGLNIKINISYGLKEIKNSNQLLAAIDEIDAKTYLMKMDKSIS